ncbi:Uncharacterized protein Fot_35227 [Forsythia ovata]|uniref:Uncharacterized protein n=1 Tax=Forsythia ovata TaxID=205694 RepID=A0ABD1SKX4_9LAMI
MGPRSAPSRIGLRNNLVTTLWAEDSPKLMGTTGRDEEDGTACGAKTAVVEARETLGSDDPFTTPGLTSWTEYGSLVEFLGSVRTTVAASGDGEAGGAIDSFSNIKVLIGWTNGRLPE